MSAGLPADRPGRGIQPGDQVPVFDAVDIVDTHIHDTGRVFRRRRHVAVYCARNGRRDQPWFVRSLVYFNTRGAAVAFLRHRLTGSLRDQNCLQQTSETL